jgi:hypothetical protein
VAWVGWNLGERGTQVLYWSSRGRVLRSGMRPCLKPQKQVYPVKEGPAAGLMSPPLGHWGVGEFLLAGNGAVCDLGSQYARR